MAIVLGLDLGTTTITALAFDSATGQVVTTVTQANEASITAPADNVRGRSEWDITAIARTACTALRQLTASLSTSDLAGLGITGQQHGVVVVDEHLQPLSPFINWQDRRGDEPYPNGDGTWVDEARRRTAGFAHRAGCRLSAGYMAVTLFWLAHNRRLPSDGTACFVMDYMTAHLTGNHPVTDATCAASSGCLDIVSGNWAGDLIDALELPRKLFPPIRPSGQVRGEVTTEMARETGLPSGLPVCVGIGDNQASFLGSVADLTDTILVNVGTGGQVTLWSPHVVTDPRLEVRPFPGAGYLLVSAGLCGGAAYAVLERFFRGVGNDILGMRATPEEVYQAMNHLAERTPAGCDGLICEPFFTGTRAEPDRRGRFIGISAANCTPGHLARALLEGMARTFAESGSILTGLLRRSPGTLVGAGNGIRANPLLARLISDAFGLPLRVPAHREEAACGAALLAAVSTGAVTDFAAAGRLIRHIES